MTDHTGIAIVMPAYHYGAHALSHCTVAFLGSVNEVDYTQRQAQRVVDRLAALDLWQPHQRIRTNTTGYEWFGVEKDIPVALLPRDERILEVRECAERLLNDYAIEFSKTWEYRPHISLKIDPRLAKPWDEGWDLAVSLRPPVLWWGNDRPETTDIGNLFHV